MKKPKSRRRKRNSHLPDKRDDRKELVEMQERVQRTWRTTRWKDKSELELSNPIETDQRHYCRYCKRKREERFMHVVGKGAFGKNSWSCADDFKICHSIRDHKSKLPNK